MRYPRGVKGRSIRVEKPVRTKTNKYGAKKTVVDGITFDSKAEAEYYQLLKLQGVSNFKMQETFVLQDKFSINGKMRLAIKYKPDFTFYNSLGELIKVVDVKGKRTADFNIKAKMFMYRYQIPLILAKYDYKNKVFEEEMA
ncbi:hypothetical protein CBF34_07140 [Vagococcus penaei]|uniref:DUF1064 domain-containing protein n=1 Tax=Vagococcus penaei TaxID=633807 RepID=UPI000F85BBF0|nr:DUF1064 domain-containing protein [Vagococcus penaei]RSU01426.1 hypothetical protein CBF34_07140 [Vagococcus penaei]